MFDKILGSLTSADHGATVLLVLAAVVLLLFVGLLAAIVSVRRLNRKLQSLMRGSGDANLEEVLNRHMDRVEDVDRRIEAVEHAAAVLQAQAPACLQQVRLLRFDAFPDVGGEQSFAAAILDGRGDGIVLSSVFSRADVRIYAKSIQNGHASHTLSLEEQSVLSQSS